MEPLLLSHHPLFHHIQLPSASSKSNNVFSPSCRSHLYASSTTHFVHVSQTSAFCTAPSGFFGGSLLPFFVDAVKDGRFSGLKLVTTNAAKLASDYGSPSITVHQVDYSKRETLEAGLKGADIVVSAMSVTDPSHGDSAQNLIEAAAAVGVKTYFPSEVCCKNALVAIPGSHLDSILVGIRL